MGFLFVLFLIAIPILFVAGLVTIIVAKEPKEKKRGIKLLIASVIMLIIAGGVCGLMLSNLNLGNMH